MHGPRRRVHTHTSAIRASHPKPPSPPGHVCRPRSHLKLVADWTLSDADSRDRPTALRLKCLSQQAHLASTQIAATPLITNAVRILAFASCATTPRLGPHGRVVGPLCSLVRPRSNHPFASTESSFLLSQQRPRCLRPRSLGLRPLLTATTEMGNAACQVRRSIRSMAPFCAESNLRFRSQPNGTFDTSPRGQAAPIHGGLRTIHSAAAGAVVARKAGLLWAGEM